MEKFKIDGGVNDYATTIETTEEERKQLISEGYIPFSRYKIKDTKSVYYGKTEELWVR